MKIECLHGYFTFREEAPGEISRYMRLTGFDIVPKGDKFTFAFLENAKDYSIEGADYLGFTALKTFEGDVPEIFKNNSIVYDFSQDRIVSLVTVFQLMTITRADNYYLSNGLILPGSLDKVGRRAKSYVSEFSFSKMRYIYPWIDLS